jgi:hypothetical protein
MSSSIQQARASREARLSTGARAIRTNHYSRRTEEAYVGWIRRSSVQREASPDMMGEPGLPLPGFRRRAETERRDANPEPSAPPLFIRGAAPDRLAEGRRAGQNRNRRPSS